MTTKKKSTDLLLDLFNNFFKLHEDMNDLFVCDGLMYFMGDKKMYVNKKVVFDEYTIEGKQYIRFKDALESQKSFEINYFNCEKDVQALLKKVYTQLNITINN
jgi:hypothetical protein